MTTGRDLFGRGDKSQFSPRGHSRGTASEDGTASTSERLFPTLLCRRNACWVVFSLQFACVLILAVEAGSQFFERSTSAAAPVGHVVEVAVFLALILGLICSGVQLREILKAQKHVDRQLRIATGAFVDLLEEHFEQWELTPSERDVALMALKGLTIAEIGLLRRTKIGTIKAQCNSIYRKANVRGRPQLLSIFIEELIAQGGVTTPRF